MGKNKDRKNQHLAIPKVRYSKIINIFYSALMVFLVFTAGNDLIKGLIGGFHAELLLYVLLWLTMVIQTTFAYVHIRKVSKNYKILAFLSDCIDICIFIYVCAAIINTCKNGAFDDMDSYRHISVPFLILSFNQLCWYIFVKEKQKAAAVIRLVLLFAVMLTTTLLEKEHHNIGMLATIIISNFMIMVILRAINWAPESFKKQMDEIIKEK